MNGRRTTLTWRSPSSTVSCCAIASATCARDCRAASRLSRCRCARVLRSPNVGRTSLALPRRVGCFSWPRRLGTRIFGLPFKVGFQVAAGASLLLSRGRSALIFSLVCTSVLKGTIGGSWDTRCFFFLLRAVGVCISSSSPRCRFVRDSAGVGVTVFGGSLALDSSLGILGATPVGVSFETDS